MRIVCWITKGRNTHSEHEIFIASLRQKRLRERPSMLHYTYIACIHHAILLERVPSGSELTNFQYHFRLLIRSFKYFNTTANVILQIHLLGIYTGSIIPEQVLQPEKSDSNHTAHVRAGSCTKRICLQRCRSYLLTYLLTYLITYSIAQFFLRS